MESQLILGDSVERLKSFEPNSVDVVITDPPYGYSFMGKDWDKVLPDKRIWKECLRVLKHGGFAYIMSSPRQDVLARMMADLEDTGFRTDFTSIYWAYASGFPKAMNISKAVDKKLGFERDVIGKRSDGVGKISESGIYELNNPESKMSKEVEITKPESPQAKKLDGSYAGFQPKPALEVILVCMKPLSEKNYVEQALSNGKGVTWLDDCRIPSTDKEGGSGHINFAQKHAERNNEHQDRSLNRDSQMTEGRFLANLLVSDNALDVGKKTKSTGGMHGSESMEKKGYGFKQGVFAGQGGYGDEGDFSRYFSLDAWAAQFIITPKPSKSEKNKGLDEWEEKNGGVLWGNRKDKKPSMKTGSGNERNTKLKNTHPTVKPLKLMSYLITLGSRENDVVLDPFMGSGTTLLAAKEINRKYIGIERESEYYKIACERIGFTPTENPIKENQQVMKEEPREATKQTCDVCGYLAKDKTEFDAHLERRFHQERA